MTFSFITEHSITHVYLEQWGQTLILQELIVKNGFTQSELKVKRLMLKTFTQSVRTINLSLKINSRFIEQILDTKSS
jgi:hypothetical protein